MKRLMITAAVIAAALRLATPAFAQVDGQVIYGSDDRIDLYQTESAKLRSLADSTVALMQASSVKAEGAVSTLVTEPYGTGNGLCKEEPFYNQVTAAFCSRPRSFAQPYTSLVGTVSGILSFSVTAKPNTNFVPAQEESDVTQWPAVMMRSGATSEPAQNAAVTWL